MYLSDIVKLLFLSQALFVMLAYFASIWFNMTEKEKIALWLSVISIIFFTMGFASPDRISLTLFSIPIAFIFISWFVINRIRSKLLKL